MRALEELEFFFGQVDGLLVAVVVLDRVALAVVRRDAPEYQASSAGHQTLRRLPTTSAPGPFCFAGSSGAFVEGFLKKLASVVCFIDPVEDLRPLMVLLRSLRRRAAEF